jgi:hypothetical protein
LFVEIKFFVEGIISEESLLQMIHFFIKQHIAIYLLVQADLAALPGNIKETDSSD